MRSLRVVLCVLAASVVAAAPVRPADAAPSESPARRIARLRAEAARVQRTIDRMNNQIERLVEDYNANTEALARTVAAERRTMRRLSAAEQRLGAAQQVLDRRARHLRLRPGDRPWPAARRHRRPRRPDPGQVPGVRGRRR